MDELNGRLELVRDELGQLQEGFRAYDLMMCQVMGWAVTVGLAAAGLAMIQHAAGPALLGIFSTIAFLLIEAHRKTLQRMMITRSAFIERELATRPLAEALAVGSPLLVPNMASQFVLGWSSSLATRYRAKSVLIFREAARPTTLAIYAALVLVLVSLALTV